MAQCGSGNALPRLQFRKDDVDQELSSGSASTAVKDAGLNAGTANGESPFQVAGHACRPDCGACCIAPSISSPIPGMPDGKPAGVRCVQLGDDLRCAIFGRPERPACCSGLQPQFEMCGANRGEALAWLTQLEAQTQPQPLSRR
jgi:hypothetical protein